MRLRLQEPCRSLSPTGVPVVSPWCPRSQVPQRLCPLAVVQSLSRVQLFAIPWTTACQASLSFTISWSLLILMSFESVILSDHLILGHLLLFLPSIFPRIRVFSNELALHIRWPKYWSFHFSLGPSNEYSGLFSIRIYCFDLLTVKDSQESSAAPQFESINSLALSLLKRPALTSMRDYWKNHSFDYTDLCRQNDVSAFSYAV